MAYPATRVMAVASPSTMTSVPFSGYLDCSAALRNADLRSDASRAKALALFITGTDTEP